MPNRSKPKIAPEDIADKASRDEDVSLFFTLEFTVVRPVRQVNVDLAKPLD